MDFPRRLLAWRRSKELTLLQVSERSGVSLALLTKAECGHRDLGTWALYAVVRRALRITMAEFWAELPRAKRHRSGRPRSLKPQMLARAA